jgi:hypothetical protein
MGSGGHQVIELRLATAEELFQLPQTDLFSEYRNYLTGVELCVSELRGRRDRRPVRLEISLPSSEIDGDIAGRMARSLRRYCDHRSRYNGSERRATRYNGFSSLRVGVPMTIIGLVLTVAALRMSDDETIPRLVIDHLGWVLAWTGLWFPLDCYFFYPLAYGRENRVLALLRDADLVVLPYSVAAADSPN